MTKKSPGRLKRLLSPTAYARLLLAPHMIEAHFRRLKRQQNRTMFREMRHATYAAGGRTQQQRERERRVAQIMSGRLTVSNGLVTP